MHTNSLYLNMPLLQHVSVIMYGILQADHTELTKRTLKL